MRQWQTITRQLSLNVTSLHLPRELNEAARKRERCGVLVELLHAALSHGDIFLENCAHSAQFATLLPPFPSHLTCSCRLASKILKITQAHTKEAAAKSWRRNNLEAMDMPVDDEDESDSGEVGREEEFAQRMKRKAKEEQVRLPRSALLL